jgi:hypothetical protein
MANFIAQNLTASDVEIGDLGITVPSSGQYNLLQLEYHSIASSDDLTAAINGDQIVFIDSDGITQLTKQQSLDAFDNKFSTQVTSTPLVLGDLSNVTLSSEQVDDILAYNGTNWVNISPGGDANVPALQVTRAATISSAAWTDVLWESVDIETDNTVIEHDNVNTQRITFKEVGFYKLSYKIDGYMNAAGRLRYNDTTTIAGSETDLIGLTDVGGIFDGTLGRGLSSSDVIVEITTANDYVTLQCFGTDLDGQGINLNKITLTAISLQSIQGQPGQQGPAGQDGADGADGENTIIVEDGGIIVPNGPFTTMNFNGAGVTASDGGAGTVDITIPGGSGGSSIDIEDEGTPVPNTPFDTINFTGNGVTVTDGGAGTATVAIPGNRFIVSDRHNGTVLQSFGGTAVTLLFDTLVREDSPFSYSVGEVTLSQSGWYKLQFNVAYTQTSGNSRSSVVGSIEANSGSGFTQIPGTITYGYSRQTAVGFGTINAYAYYQATAGDIIRVRSNVNAGRGTITTVNNGSRFTIEYEGFA